MDPRSQNSETTHGDASWRPGRAVDGRLRARPRVDLSIVIPVHDEVESVPVLAGEIDAVFERWTRSWECLWIDDGSTDGTFDRLVDLHRRDPEHHQYAALERRSGQSGALVTGFRIARGEMVGTLDGDLQNDPAELPRLAAMLDRGRTDMATGVRTTRRDGWLRRVSSRIANGFRNRVTGDRIQDVGCSLRVFYRECVDDMPVFRGMHRFLPTLVRMRGFSVQEVPVSHRPRTLGRTKYGVHNRLWGGILDCFAVRWMRSRMLSPRIRETSLGSHEEERSTAL